MSDHVTSVRPPRRLATFTGRGYTKGAGLATVIAWVAVGQPVVASVWCPSRVRVAVLRAFGATIGRGTLIRQGVRVHWPWRLRIGRDCWIGVDTWLLNLEPIVIGNDVCISQGAFLCTGSHDADDPAFEFDNAPITVQDGAWVAARAVVLRGVTVGEGAIVGATALVVRDVAPFTRLLAPPATTVGQP